MKEEMIAGSIGTALSLTGTTLAPNEVLEIISLVISIIGAIITFIIVPLMSWYKSAKKDGKIDKEEVKDGAKIIIDGASKVAETIEKEDNKKCH